MHIYANNIHRVSKIAIENYIISLKVFNKYEY